MAQPSGLQSYTTVMSKSDMEIDVDDHLNYADLDAPTPDTPQATMTEQLRSEKRLGDEDVDDDASNILQAISSQQCAQTWKWEQQWVEIERPFVAPSLKLRKWVRVPAEKNKNAKNRPLTVETSKDGMKILVGGFMEYYCPHPGCGKVFPAVGSLRKHMHIHGEKHFVCPVGHCGKRFLDNSKLKRHMAIHFRSSESKSIKPDSTDTISTVPSSSP